MMEIKELIVNIDEEIDDAGKYAELAHKYKDFDKPLADTYITLANQELGHADMLHAQAVRLIKEHTEEPPDGMRAVWDYEHEKFIERKAKVKTVIDMFR